MSLAPEIMHEYRELQAARGFVELSDRTKLELRGGDRTALLHKFCTNEIKRLLPGEGCEAFVCNAKGHILAHIHVLCGEDALRLDAAAGQGEFLAAHFDRYIIREDVQIVDCTDQYKAILTFGELPAEFTPYPQFAFGMTPHARLTWLPHTVSLPDTLLPCSRAALEIVRIEQGYPLFGIEFGDRNLPQEIGRDAQTLSFTKGCYLGQETVARLASLGHVNQSLGTVLFEGETVPPAGTTLHANDKAIGEVTSSCWSPRENAPLAIAWLRRAHSAPGSVVQWSGGAGRVLG